MGLKTPEDWNSLTQKQIQINGGRRLLAKYSICDLKCIGCPEYKSYYNPKNKSRGYWNEKQNVIQYLQELKLKLNLNTVEDWNSIK